MYVPSRGYQLMSLIQLNKVYMHELIDGRTSGPKIEDRDDLLSRMISARETEKDSPYHFTNAKLTGGPSFASWIRLLTNARQATVWIILSSLVAYLLFYSVCIRPCRS